MMYIKFGDRYTIHQTTKYSGYTVLRWEHQTAKWLCFPHACQVAIEWLAKQLPGRSNLYSYSCRCTEDIA